MRSLPLAAVLLLSSCTSREPPPAAPVVSAPSTSSTSSTASAPTSPAPPVTRPAPAMTTMSGAKPDEPITLRGRVSKTPWQHMMTGVPGKSDAYFDLGGGKEQTVVYWKAPPSCAGDVEVVGTVLEVKGASKGGKADEIRELHVDVSSARCVE